MDPKGVVLMCLSERRFALGERLRALAGRRWSGKEQNDDKPY